MTRELKLAVIVGFSLVLVVTVLISDHLSKARQVHLAEVSSSQPALVSAPAERAVTVPPPSAERRVASRQPDEDGFSLGGAPRAMRTTDIVQGHGGGVVTNRTESPTASGNVGDPDKPLIDQLRGNGLAVVENGAVRDIVPKDSPVPVPGKVDAVPAVPERTHTVVEGDSLFKIGKQYYGDAMAWKKLGAANGLTPDSSLKIGMKIKLPPSEQITGKPTPPSVLATNQPAGKTAKPPAPAKAPEPSKAKFASYVVKRGDTITEIARRQLGSTGRAGEVIRLNETQLEDEDTLQAGMVLKLPLS